MKITVNCIIKNEDIWFWYAIQSVLPFVDKILIFDTGSFDKTSSIVKTIKSKKIIFEEKGPVDKKGLTVLRQEQLNRTETDWLLILDGDEIWSEDSFEKSIEKIENSPQNTVGLIHKVRNCIGDVFHYLPEDSGDYNIGRYKGNLNIRFIKKTKEMKVIGEYPLEYYSDENGPIQDQDENLIFADCWYLHTGFLKRSSVDNAKTSGSLGKKKFWEKGRKMDLKELPETLFLKNPTKLFNPLAKRSFGYELTSNILDPLLKIKRKIK